MENRKKPIPLYHQAYELFLRRLQSGEWAEGDRLPREADLCSECGMSRITIRQALEALKTEGYLTSRQGKGTFVRPRPVERQLNTFYSFSDRLPADGRQPRSVVLSCRACAADDAAAQKLGLAPGESVFRVVRLRCLGEEPFAYEISHLPVRLFPAMTAAAIRESGLYAAMGALAPDAAEETFCAAAMEPAVARRLCCAPRSPALQIERVASCRGNVVEYCRTVARGDSIRYHVALQK